MQNESRLRQGPADPARGAQVASLADTIGGWPDSDLESELQASGFAWVFLPRHGKRPARFFGREMLHASDHDAATAERHAFWCDIRIFEVFDGGFVTAMRHYGLHDDAVAWQDAWFSLDPARVVRALRNHGSAGAWSTAQGGDIAARLQAWLAFVRTTFGDARPA